MTNHGHGLFMATTIIEYQLQNLEMYTVYLQFWMGLVVQSISKTVKQTNRRPTCVCSKCSSSRFFCYGIILHHNKITVLWTSKFLGQFQHFQKFEAINCMKPYDHDICISDPAGWMYIEQWWIAMMFFEYRLPLGE